LDFWDFSIFEISELHEYSVAGFSGLVNPLCQSSKWLGVFPQGCGKTILEVLEAYIELFVKPLCDTWRTGT
jgi:hypothetical protein